MTTKQHPLFVGLIAGVLTVSVFAIVGVCLLKTGVLGQTLFMLLPFATGVAVAMAAYPKVTVWISLVLFLLCGFIGLIAAKLEGLLCCLMVLPLVVPGVIAGALFGFLIRRWIRKNHGANMLCIGLAGLAVLGGHGVEQQLPNQVRQESVTTSVMLEASPELVWEQLKAFDHIEMGQSVLFKLGLPIPVRCSLKLENERVGGQRICYFKNGYIEELITAWEPPRRMNLRIVRSTVPGRHWLSYLDASYVLSTEGQQTRVTRMTRIGSQLRPAWYWRIMERLGVETEHHVIFNQLKANLDSG